MSRSLRRLMKEASELSSSPSPHFHAQPISDSNLYDWHFTLAGPPSPSPYAGGIYHGRIVLPPTYPLRPPSFRFLTPSGRFEVNREICLSISGHHEETWQPAWGIRTALLAIRSFMDGDVKGQVGGLDGVSDDVRREYAKLSRGWCCEGCAEGCWGGKMKSNEEVLGEWRGFCVEKGVDVEREEDAEGVPEELRIEVKKSATGGGEGSTEGRTKVSTLTSSSDHVREKVGGPTDTDPAINVKDNFKERSSPTPTPKQSTLKPEGPSSPEEAGPGVASSNRSLSGPQVRIQQQQQQQRPVPSRMPNQVARVGSQDSPWLDRAIFGVLVALIVMILRRVVNLDD